MPLVAIVDAAAGKSQCFGVRSVASLDDAGPIDAVVIAESLAPQQIYEELRERLSDDRILAPAILRITPDRDQLISAARRGEKPS
jgi:hypothetical protein